MLLSLLAKDIFPSQQPSPPSKEKVGIDQGWTIDGTQSFHCRHGLGRWKMDSSLWSELSLLKLASKRACHFELLGEIDFMAWIEYWMINVDVHNCTAGRNVYIWIFIRININSIQYTYCIMLISLYVYTHVNVGTFNQIGMSRVSKKQSAKRFSHIAFDRDPQSPKAELPRLDTSIRKS